MQTIALDAVPIAGVVERKKSADGLILRRSQGALLHELDGNTGLATWPAGMRLALLTDARVIELDVLPMMISAGEAMPLMAAVFDLVVGGERRSSLRVTEGTLLIVDPSTRAMQIVPGAPTTVRFDGLPGDPTVPVEVWLPHRGPLELRAVRVSDGASVSPVPRRRRWVHYGSSISHCLEVEHPTDAWPAITARLANVDLISLAFAAQCMLDQHVARTIRDLDVDLISLKAGINIVHDDVMRERAFVPALHGFIDTIRDRHPALPIVVATPIISPAVEETGIATGALSLRRVRELTTRVVDARMAAGDKALHLIDGLSLFGPNDVADLPDGLHPNGAGYRRIGERFHALAFEAGPFSEA